jgi:hypothetical protein
MMKIFIIHEVSFNSPNIRRIDNRAEVTFSGEHMGFLGDQAVSNSVFFVQDTIECHISTIFFSNNNPFMECITENIPRQKSA